MMVQPIVAGKATSATRYCFAQQGFTYLAVMLLVLILLLSLGAASEHIVTIDKREREAELIFIGEQYRNAIASYYNQSSNGSKQLPMTLESLILDKRSINALRHLRKLYRDPITDSNEWGLVLTPQGAITGVYSLSNEKILTTVNNPRLLQNMQLDESLAKTTPAIYSDWKFVFKPDNQDASSMSQSSVETDESEGHANEATE